MDDMQSVYPLEKCSFSFHIFNKDHPSSFNIKVINPNDDDDATISKQKQRLASVVE